MTPMYDSLLVWRKQKQEKMEHGNIDIADEENKGTEESNYVLHGEKCLFVVRNISTVL